MTEETQALVEQARTGNGAAIDTLLERHLPGLHAFIRLRVGPAIRVRESPSDLVQSVCREVLEDLGGFDYRGDAAFKQWLYKRAINKIVDRDRYYRAEKRGGDRVLPPGADQRVLECYQTFCTPSRVAAGKEEMERVEGAFRRLPDNYREVILLSRIFGFSNEEIATEMNRNPGAVRTLLCRALARLASLLGQ